ncbi:protein ORF3 [Lake sturgeon herpesvirus]|nr:protein ORF3 [Lake sturgeon herpesvirus]
MNTSVVCYGSSSCFTWPATCRDCKGTCELSYLRQIYNKLSLCSQQQIREFIEMSTPEMRLLTFKAWPSDTFALHRMAQDGFYYCGVKDQVKCFHCSAVLSDWYHDTMGYRPRTIVNDHYSQCQPSRAIVWSTDPERYQKERAFVAKLFHNQNNEEINMTRYETRLKTLVPLLGDGVKAQQFALAGFYHLGQTDCTRCYMCQVEINKWLILDCPFKEHLRWSNMCLLVQHTVKTHSYACYAGLIETG